MNYYHIYFILEQLCSLLLIISALNKRYPISNIQKVQIFYRKHNTYADTAGKLKDHRQV